jgi:hypothetical protein
MSIQISEVSKSTAVKGAKAGKAGKGGRLTSYTYAVGSTTAAHMKQLIKWLPDWMTQHLASPQGKDMSGKVVLEVVAVGPTRATLVLTWTKFDRHQAGSDALIGAMTAAATAKIARAELRGAAPKCPAPAVQSGEQSPSSSDGSSANDWLLDGW